VPLRSALSGSLPLSGEGVRAASLEAVCQRLKAEFIEKYRQATAICQWPLFLTHYRTIILTHPGSYLSSLIKENVPPFFDTLGLSGPLRALTIFFWPGEPEAGFGVALKKGNENHKLLSAAYQAKKRQASGCKGLSAPGPLPYKMPPAGGSLKKEIHAGASA
jgi:hypothetical protein